MSCCCAADYRGPECTAQPVRGEALHPYVFSFSPPINFAPTSPQNGRSRPSGSGRHASLRLPTWPSDTPSAPGTRLCAAYLPVDAGGRAARLDPLPTSDFAIGMRQTGHSGKRPALSRRAGHSWLEASEWNSPEPRNERSLLGPLLRTHMVRCLPFFAVQSVQTGLRFPFALDPCA